MEEVGGAWLSLKRSSVPAFVLGVYALFGTVTHAKTESCQALAIEILELSEKAVEIEGPKRFPSRFRLRVAQHVIEEYNDGSTRYPGQFFFDYQLVSREEPEFAHRVKRVWKKSTKRLGCAMPYVMASYAAIPDARQRRILVEFLDDVASEAIFKSHELAFSLLEPIFGALADEPDDPLALQLIGAFELIFWELATDEELDTFVRIVESHRGRCAVLRDEATVLAVTVINRPDLPRARHAFWNAIDGDDCREEAEIAFISNASSLRPGEESRVDQRLWDLIDQDLVVGGGVNTRAILGFFFSRKLHQDRLLEYVFKALECDDRRTVCEATDYLKFIAPLLSPAYLRQPDWLDWCNDYGAINDDRPVGGALLMAVNFWKEWRNAQQNTTGSKP